MNGHGTVSGYERHRRDGEDACADCKRARADYQADYEARNPEYAERGRRRSAARYRAMRRLALEFPKRFNELVSDELGKLK